MLGVSISLLLAIAVDFGISQQLPVNYSIQVLRSEAGDGVCPLTDEFRASVRQDLRSLINTSVLPILQSQTQGNQTQGNQTNTENGLVCGCGGSGWRRIAYLNMTDPIQTCPQNWNLITSPRRSCGRTTGTGSIMDSCCCDSAIYPAQGIRYSRVCGRINAYQKGHPEAFVQENLGYPQTIDGSYVDGISVTYGSPRQHVWSFAAAIDETNTGVGTCPCTNSNNQNTINVPSFIGNDYFCETGVPSGQPYSGSTFYADDLLWDGQGCGPTSTCCTLNNPPWFCKNLSQSTTEDLEVRICAVQDLTAENTPIELIEIYVM